MYHSGAAWQCLKNCDIRHPILNPQSHSSALWWQSNTEHWEERVSGGWIGIDNTKITVGKLATHSYYNYKRTFIFLLLQRSKAKWEKHHNIVSGVCVWAETQPNWVMTRYDGEGKKVFRVKLNPKTLALVSGWSFRWTVYTIHRGSIV